MSNSCELKTFNWKSGGREGGEGRGKEGEIRLSKSDNTRLISKCDHSSYQHFYHITCCMPGKIRVKTFSLTVVYARLNSK